MSTETGRPNTGRTGIGHTEIGRTDGFARQLFSGLPERYDTLAEVLSFGQNGRWRREMVSHLIVDDPSSVLDVATGPAGVALQIAKRSKAQVTGVDLTPEMLKRAAGNVAAAGSKGRIRLAAARGENLPFPDATFDAVSFTYLLRYVTDPAATIAELARVLKPGGVMANLEFYAPTDPVVRESWWLYTRTLLPAAGLLTGGKSWFEVGRFLGPSISDHYGRYPLEWHKKAWGDAGLTGVGVKIMSLGGGIVMWGRKG